MSNHSKGIFVTFLGVILMSVESPIIRFSQLDSHLISFLFGLCIIVTINTLLLFQKKPLLSHYSDELKGAFFSGFFMGLSNFFFILSVTHAGISKTVLILATSPLVSALIAFLFLGQKTPLRIFIATIFVFLGLYIILQDDLNNQNFFENLYAFGCVFSFSIMFVILSKFSKTSPYAYVSFGGVFIVLFSLFSLEFIYNLQGLIAIIIMGVLVTPLSRVLIGYGTRYLIPAEVGLLVIGESILAPIWGWLWLDEKISFEVFLGGSIILVALVINSLIGLKKERLKRS